MGIVIFWIREKFLLNSIYFFNFINVGYVNNGLVNVFVCVFSCFKNVEYIFEILMGVFCIFFFYCLIGDGIYRYLVGYKDKLIDVIVLVVVGYRLVGFFSVNRMLV